MEISQIKGLADLLSKMNVNWTPVEPTVEYINNKLIVHKTSPDTLYFIKQGNINEAIGLLNPIEYNIDPPVVNPYAVSIGYDTRLHTINFYKSDESAVPVYPSLNDFEIPIKNLIVYLDGSTLINPILKQIYIWNSENERDTQTGMNDGDQGILFESNIITYYKYLENSWQSINDISNFWQTDGTNTTMITPEILKLAKRFLTYQGANVASDTNLTLDNNGNYFKLSNITNQIQRIESTNWQKGSFIALECPQGTRIKHNAIISGTNYPIFLARGVDFQAAINTILYLYLNVDNVWIQATDTMDERDYMSFYVNITALQTVGILLKFASGTHSIDWGDGTPISNFTSFVEKTHTYATNGNFKIIITSTDFTAITAFIADNSRISGILDISKLTSIGTSSTVSYFDVRNNLITDIIFPKIVFYPYANNPDALSAFHIENNSIVNLDLSNIYFKYTSGLYHVPIDFSGNPLISIKGLKGTLSSLYFTNITTLKEIDLTKVTKFIGGISCTGCTSLEYMLFDVAEATSVAWTINNTIIKILDLSKVLFNNIPFYCQSNTSLIELKLFRENSIILNYCYIKSNISLKKLDFQNITFSSCLLDVSGNTAMTSLINMNGTLIGFYVNNSTSLAISLDFSNITFNSSGTTNLIFTDNAPITNMNGLKGGIGTIRTNSSNLTGTLDLSNINVDYAGTANIEFRYNSNLTDLTLNPLGTYEGTLLAQGCSLGSLNLSIWTNYSYMDFTDNAMNAAEVNENLVELDNSGLINKSILIAGTNATPDGTSGGFDGLTAKANLIGKGWTVTTN